MSSLSQTSTPAGWPGYSWLTKVVGRAVDRLCAKLGIANPAERRKWWLDWDFSNTNDKAIWDNEPEKDQLRQASALTKSDPQAALAIVLDLAEHGSVWAMRCVAWHYLNGVGVAADAAQAEDWYRRASDTGSQSALITYASILWQRGEEELREAVLNSGIAVDWAPALYRLAWSRIQRTKTRRKTLQEVRPLLERAAELGSPSARRMLAREMSLGRFGLHRVPRGLRMMWDFTVADNDAWAAAAARRLA